MTPNIHNEKENNHFDVYDLVPSDVRQQAKQAVIDAGSTASSAKKIATYIQENYIMIALYAFLIILAADILGNLLTRK